MPCNHKFQEELTLGHISYQPVTLIVGSFQPEWPATSNDDWFYGRTESNYFWDVLPRLYGHTSLLHAAPTEWKQFCHDKQLALTDLISSVDDADADNPKHRKIFAGNADSAIAFNFDDFSFVNIVQLLQRHPSVKNVYLTRGVTEAFWKHLWNPVMQYCNRNDLYERKLLSPTTEASSQHTIYNEQHPESQIALLEDYLLMKWQQEWR